ncbi:MAG: Gldg family protein [Desulfobulbaceae bacterium]|nr:Gldg family protein [Desulfobulbaceae bacterium]
MKNLMRIARKEFGGFFSSPVAFIFFGAFIAVTLFIFFWVETFFARNIADLRPLFSWMPILLIFLTAAITMRSWAEERRAGTLEFLLTSPVRPLTLVFGKFLACLGLVGIALALTVPLAFTVSMLGAVDWGPVFGGYIATLCLAAAYIAIGLFVSVRSDNQIISLISTTVICSIVYLLGSDALTGLFGNQTSEMLKLLGSGSRFESITRGVLDFRDIYYYISLVGIFLSLNVFGLERIRWAGNAGNAHHRKWRFAVILLILNFAAGNFWLAPIAVMRTDLTQGNIYSISPATRAYLAQLKEPLLLRGYFSAQTHPLLAPLVPRLRDLLKEYEIAGKGKVRVEFIDPLQSPELEQEAGEKYGIRPVPFETSNKYQASVTNSYFDIMVQYGDQFKILGFQDLIEVKVQQVSEMEVELRNPEYDITSTIKKVLYSYQGAGNLFANIKKPVVFHGYISPDEKLPPTLQDMRKSLASILEDLTKKSNGKITAKIQDPDKDSGALGEKIAQQYGFQPMASSMFDTNTFWFYMTMDNGDRIVQVPLPDGFSEEGLRRSVDAALKRFSSGFLKTVALNVTESGPPMAQYGNQGPGKSFMWLQDKLSQEHTLKLTDLHDGVVPEEADLLLVASPEELDEKQLYAIDQFLMRGGTIIIATASRDVMVQQGLKAAKHTSGLEEWLAHNGIKLEDAFVMDQQNSAFPIPIQRQLGGFTVNETRMLDYPYFADIREDGMDDESGITAGLGQVSVSWSVPINIEKEKNKDRKITELLRSSAQSWKSNSIDILPDFDRFGEGGFPVGEEMGSQLLAVAVEGRFDSWFKGKKPPAIEQKVEEKSPGQFDPAAAQGPVEDEKDKPTVTRLIERSPESARIILISSNMFLTDTSLQLASGAMRTKYENPLQLVENCIDWSLEDRGLLSIRGRGHFSRPLVSLVEGRQMFWEYLNYALVLLGLSLIWIVKKLSAKRAVARYRNILTGGVNN